MHMVTSSGLSQRTMGSSRLAVGGWVIRARRPATGRTVAPGGYEGMKEREAKIPPPSQAPPDREPGTHRPTLLRLG